MHTVLRWLRSNRGLLGFVLCILVFRSAVADWNVVPTGSMQPSIKIGDRILVDRMAYDVRVPFTHVSLVHLGDPARGDIVVLDSSAAHERLVKRVIGLPGDVVAMRDNHLFINGRAAVYTAATAAGIGEDSNDPAHYWTESFGPMRHRIRLSLQHPSPLSNFGPVRVPARQYLLLGDDRDNSYDSRYLGFFPRREILGRSSEVLYSLDPADHHLPRWSRTATQLR